MVMPRPWTLTMGAMGIGSAFQDLTCWVVKPPNSAGFSWQCVWVKIGENSNSLVKKPFVVPPLLFISTSNNWRWHGFTPWNMWCNHAHKSTRLSWFYPHVWHIPHLWVVPSPLQHRLFKHSLTALQVVLTCLKPSKTSLKYYVISVGPTWWLK